jgi:hypothetical protein
MARTTQASFDAKKSINAGYLKKKRPPNAGIGRKPGQKNVVTQSVREMFAEFVHHNAANVQSLFDRVAKKDPAKALTIYHNMADFVLPRLARTEVVASGDPLVSLNPIELSAMMPVEIHRPVNMRGPSSLVEKALALVVVDQIHVPVNQLRGGAAAVVPWTERKRALMG